MKGKGFDQFDSSSISTANNNVWYLVGTYYTFMNKSSQLDYKFPENKN